MIPAADRSWWVGWFSLGWCGVALAAPRVPVLELDLISRSEEPNLSQQPLRPALPRKSLPVPLPHCERLVRVGDRLIEEDSDAGLDGERLRPYLKLVPAARVELDLYQRNRRQLQWVAYAGTASALAIIIGLIISKPLLSDTGALTGGAWLTLGGVLLGFNAVAFSISMSAANEGHLHQAVRLYNSSRAENRAPITLGVGSRF